MPRRYALPMAFLILFTANIFADEMPPQVELRIIVTAVDNEEFFPVNENLQY